MDALLPCSGLTLRHRYRLPGAVHAACMVRLRHTVIAQDVDAAKIELLPKDARRCSGRV